MLIAEPIAGSILLSSFICFTWLLAGACPGFVAVTQRKIRVSTQDEFWPAYELLSGAGNESHIL